MANDAATFQDITVIFKASASADDKQKTMDSIKKSGGTIKGESELINGFFAKVPKSEGLSNSLTGAHPAIDSVELDQVITTQ
ncbi:hypothetical protein GGF46_000154 [Coemansia sp. RSA 552]|nr:hypothetical protein GGF46_000154 [Coemansia sp. RSA 552]